MYTAAQCDQSDLSNLEESKTASRKTDKRRDRERERLDLGDDMGFERRREKKEKRRIRTSVAFTYPFLHAALFFFAIASQSGLYYVNSFLVYCSIAVFFK